MACISRVSIGTTTNSDTGGEGGWSTGTGAGDAQSDLTIVATQLRACATKLSDSWADVQNANAADEAATEEAVSAFSQAVNESSQTLDAVAPDIKEQLNGKLTAIETRVNELNEKLSQTSTDLDTVAKIIEQLQGTLDTIDAEIAALDPNDPDYESDLAALQAEREEPAAKLAEAQESKATLEKTLEAANATLNQLNAHLPRLNPNKLMR